MRARGGHETQTALLRRRLTFRGPQQRVCFLDYLWRAYKVPFAQALFNHIPTIVCSAQKQIRFQQPKLALQSKRS